MQTFAANGIGSLVPRQITNEQSVTPIAKSLARQTRSKLPDYVHHQRSDAVRRIAMMHNHVLADHTPHLDAYTLRSFAGRNLAVQMVIHTILDQVASHFVRPRGKDSIGLKVVQKEKGHALTAATAKEAKRITDILFMGGIPSEHPDTGEVAVWDSHAELEADGLDAAIRKIMRDSLTLDKTFVEVEASMSGKEPVAFWRHVDGALVYRVDTKHYMPEVRTGAHGTDDLRGKVKYVQFAADMDYRVEREYMWREGFMGHRNPNPSFLSFGYGRPEVEDCLGAAMGVLYAMQANQDWFDKNHVPNGIISVFGNFDRSDLEDMRAQFQYEVGMGSGSMWSVPILAAQPQQGNAVAYTPFVDKSRMDMVSKTYLELCIAFVSAIFKIAPEEMGFHSFGGPASTLGEGSQEEKLEHSKGKGHLPRILWLLGQLQRLIELINSDFEVEIQGLEERYGQEAIQKQQVVSLKLQNGMTLNQLAAEDDEPPIVDPLDEELWEEVSEGHADKFYGTERERVEACVKDYKAAGGKLGNYPNMPGNPVMVQVWMQEHGINQQQQTQDQMGQMAQGEAQGQMAGEQADKQFAQQGMQNMAAADQELAHGEDMADGEAKRAGELRIPGAQDAGYDLSELRKALQVRRVVGPRDA